MNKTQKNKFVENYRGFVFGVKDILNSYDNFSGDCKEYLNEISELFYATSENNFSNETHAQLVSRLGYILGRLIVQKDESETYAKTHQLVNIIYNNEIKNQKPKPKSLLSIITEKLFGDIPGDTGWFEETSVMGKYLAQNDKHRLECAEVYGELCQLFEN
ncbi:hypothetical protein [Polynucleobacter sp. Tro8-14-1]|nr:hypothetical protein [Polynucleobacter sp. Tro8-14-1]MBU3562353.1 hypothetical protein [Polynucleobacter sp. Tro8-14-1]